MTQHNKETKVSEKQEENQDTIIEQSPEIDKLAEALAIAQGEMPHAELDGINTFLKKKDMNGNETPSKYATLKSLISASKESLSKNGLSVTQLPTFKGGNNYLCVQLMHKTGQWLRGYYPLIAKTGNDPQSLGAAVTYARRHSLGAVVGLAAEEDDDGNSQSGNLGGGGPVNKSGNKTIDKWWRNVVEDMSASVEISKLEAIYSKAKSEDRLKKLSNEQLDLLEEQYENRRKYLSLVKWIDDVIEDIHSFENLDDLEGYMHDIRTHGNSKVISKEMGARIKQAHGEAKEKIQNEIPDFSQREKLTSGDLPL